MTYIDKGSPRAGVDGKRQTEIWRCDICKRKTHVSNIEMQFREDGDYQVCTDCNNE